MMLAMRQQTVTRKSELRSGRRQSADLAVVLDALEADHAFLLEGDVFTADLLEAYIGYKREVEVDGVRLRPHPSEFSLYYGI